jgi:hypothetical protein
VTTQDQANGPASDGRFRKRGLLGGIRYGLDRVAAKRFTMVASHGVRLTKAILSAGCFARSGSIATGKSQRVRGYYETGCKILKQVADTFYHKRRPWTKVDGGFFVCIVTGMGSRCRLS